MKNIFVLILLTLSGCSASNHYVRYQDGLESKSENCAIDFYSENLELHRKTQVIGEIQIRDTGFSLSCDAETVIKQIKEKACTEGADAIHLYNVSHPSWRGSTCFQANARFLKYVGE
ncbi:hypothetical protein EGC76_11820 [Pseudidiomarina gelatinasegens]|uniref:DUF4156 domain-containing protein n=1 Tax=Pseudidiomarina gelatinasegens TaxID=2487740 RepID=A0A443YVF9_9GAMM|nr:hypothetical protein [Pseudidiomarina gelatinasegens]RWU07927.1 hypothetical protein EGC76_11820 [Pseudidiomarina gelatinasegens]